MYFESDNETFIETSDELFLENDEASYDEAYDESSDEGAEFTGNIARRLSGIGRRVGRNVVRGGSFNVNTPTIPSGLTSGIQAASNLAARIIGPSGRAAEVKLPGSVATKADIEVLKKAVDANTKAIGVNTNSIKQQATAITNLRTDLKKVDDKHNAATREQNKVIADVNSRVSKLKKELTDTRKQGEMQALMSLLIQPKIKNLTFEKSPEAGVSATVKESSFETNMLPLLFAFGGFGGGDGGNNMMLPLALILMNDKK
jgi:acetylornithine deacetylase/succinyl-diaminopimelate desuccinylase-like protein